MTLTSQKYLTALDMGPLYQKLIHKLEKCSSDINSLMCGDNSLCFKDEDIFLQANRQFFQRYSKTRSCWAGFARNSLEFL